MKRWAFHLLLAMTFALAGCEQRQSSQAEQITLQEKSLSHTNPTTYEFDATMSEVKGAIKDGFETWREEQIRKYQAKVWGGSGNAECKRFLTFVLQSAGGGSLLWGDDGALISKALPAKPGNENDAYIYGGEAPVGESRVYFKDGQALIYYADFHVHLTAVGTNRTRVEIFTYDCRVAVGAEKRWTVHRYGPSLIVVNVAPTTVEEYQVLLRIGEQLGTKNMPPLITPGTNSPVKQLTKQRQ